MLTKILIVLAVLAAIVLASRWDYAAEQAEESIYCLMVEAYQKDPNTGWPPYRPEIDCAQIGEQ